MTDSIKRRLTRIWSRIPARWRAQVSRAVRVFAITAVPAVLVGMRTNHLSWTLLASVVTAAAETAYRQVVVPPEAKALLGVIAAKPLAVAPSKPAK